MKLLAALPALALFWFIAPLSAQDRPAAADPVVELPKFVVTDNRELPPPESWRYGTMPGFEILSNASVKGTQRLLRDFDMFRQALSLIWPMPQRISQPTALIICGKGAKFDKFIPAGKISADTAFASLFLKRGTQTAIVIDLESTTLNVLDLGNDSAGTDNTLMSVEHDKQLYREYVRYLLSNNEPRLPAWFEEGLSQIIMRMQFDKRYIEFAKLEDPNTISAAAAMVAQINELNAAAGGEDGDATTLAGAPAEDRDFPAALRRRALLPLQKFFEVQHDSPEATNTLGNNRWGKQAYAFVHMCLYGYKGKYQKQFMTFLQRSAREPVTEQMFKECFRFSKGKGKDGKETFREMSYKDMLMEIRSYCDFTVYEAKIFKATGKEDLVVAPKPLELRDATQSEVGRIKGETLVLAGHTKLARTELVAPYTRGERDPDLLAALGLYDRENGESERGRKFLEAAYAAKTKRPDAGLELARMRYADALAKPAGPEGQFAPAQVAAILAPVLAVRLSPPHMPALYDLVADTWTRSAAKPQLDDVKVMIDGAQLFPMRMKLIFVAAGFAADVNELQAAHALADHGIKHTPEGPGRKRFQDLKASLPPAPPAAEPPPAAKQPAATKKK
ncbi:MAG: hypothetical protein Q8N18_14810 [Opitutaceae bacterium]|nr:hypothetical protein [Opitutaceae bacterium]